MARLSVAYTIRSNFASDVLGSCEENMLKVFFMEWIWFFNHILL